MDTTKHTPGPWQTGRANAHLIAAAPEQAVKDAMDVLQAAYYNEIRGIVEEMKQAIKDGEITSREGVDDWLHDTLDGHGDVIYTQKAQRVIMISDNADAWEELYNSTPNWSQMAYCAMEADVREHIDEEEIEMLLDPENDDYDDDEDGE